MLECDETGAVSRILEKPARVGEENKGYLEKLDFRPIKVLYAGREDIYVLVENCISSVSSATARTARFTAFSPPIRSKRR